MARNQVTDSSFFLLPCAPPAPQKGSLPSLSLLIPDNRALSLSPHSHAKCGTDAAPANGSDVSRALTPNADPPALPSRNSSAKGFASLGATRAHRFVPNKASRHHWKPHCTCATLITQGRRLSASQRGRTS